MEFYFVIIGLMLSGGYSQTTDENNTNSSAVTPAPYVPPEDYLVELEFHIREEKVPVIINYLLNNSLEERSIAVSDIIQLTGLKSYNLESTLHLLQQFNVSSQDAFSVASLEALYRGYLNLRFSMFYNQMLEKLSITQQTAVKGLEELSIEQVAFLFAMIDPDDGVIYDVLRKGTYDEVHVNAALSKINKTGEELFLACREVVLEEIHKLNSTYFMGILRERGLSRHNVFKLWDALHITTQDVYQVPKFRDILENITTTLNENQTLAVVIGNKKLAVHELIFHRIVSNVEGDTIKVTVRNGGDEVDVAKHLKLGPRVLELQLKAETTRQSIQISDDYSRDKEEWNNCKYVIRLKSGETVSEEISVERGVNDFTGLKNETIAFSLGSPLVCSNYLYGLAGEDVGSLIKFDSFYTKDYVDQGENGENSSLSTVFQPKLFLLLLLIRLYN